MPNSLGSAKRTRIQWVRFIFICLVFVLVAAGCVAYALMQPISDDPSSLDEIITISAGMPSDAIAEMLASRGIISNAKLFKLLTRVTNTAKSLKAGEYLLNSNMSPLDVLETLKQGKVNLHRVVIPEGFDLEQIATLLTNEQLVNYEHFLTLAQNVNLVYSEGLPFEMPLDTLEGYLFPDTYHFVMGQGEESIIRTMVARFVEYALPQIDLAVYEGQFSLHEIITLASIVEKEVVVDYERPMVAAVYLNRLNINMRLQADPTVRYVMEEDRDRVLYRDLEIDSPYNTYRNDGLPLGPIASPGIESIKAVLEPADVDYLYFLSKRDGTHAFTRTFAEHVAARNEYGY